MTAYIQLEGGDGVGKSCAAKALYRALTDLGHRCALTSGPTTSTIGALIRDRLRGGYGSTQSWQLLCAADRMEHSAKICTWLDAGTIVIVIGDRGALSTWAYALAMADAADDPRAEEIAAWADGLSRWAVEPSLIIVLQADIGACLARLEAKKRDVTESAKIQRLVHAAYAGAHRSRLGHLVEYVDANGSENEVSERVVAVALKHLARSL